MKFKHYLCLLLLSMGTLSVLGQSVEVRGKVIDATLSTPLAGVSIKVKNATKGTISNSVGEFQLNAKASDVLVWLQID